MSVSLSDLNVDYLSSPVSLGKPLNFGLSCLICKTSRKLLGPCLTHGRQLVNVSGSHSLGRMFIIRCLKNTYHVTHVLGIQR